MAYYQCVCVRFPTSIKILGHILISKYQVKYSFSTHYQHTDHRSTTLVLLAEVLLLFNWGEAPTSASAGANAK